MMAYILCLVGAWFGFANPVYQFPALVLLFPASLCWLAFQSQNVWQALKRCWLAGGITYALCLYWLVIPVHYYGPLPWYMAVPCPLLLGIYLGLYPGIFGIFLFWASKRFSWWTAAFFSGIIWVCLEYLRGFLLTGFPWLTLPQALAPWPWSIQAVKLLGSYALSGIFVMAVAWIVLGYNKSQAYVWAIFIFLAVFGYGLWQFHLPMPGNESYELGIVQGNIDQNQKWDPAFKKKTLQTYLSMSRNCTSAKDPVLIIWPETAMPFYLQDKSEYSEQVFAFAKKNNIFLITGSPGYKFKPDGDYQVYNRAYLINRQGRIADIYAKEHLVPFGEYTPFSRYFPFLGKLVAGISDFSPGEGTSAEPLKIGQISLGPLICYEVIFPGLVQKRVKQGSNCLINLSNDAWFGRSSAPQQHLNQAVLRAIEQNRFIIRSTNTGISGIIDPKGRILNKSGLFQKKCLAGEIGLIQERTFFSRYFSQIYLSIFIVACVLFVAGALKIKGWKDK